MTHPLQIELLLIIPNLNKKPQMPHSPVRFLCFKGLGKGEETGTAWIGKMDWKIVQAKQMSDR